MTNTYGIQISLLTPNSTGGITSTVTLSDDGTTFIAPDAPNSLADLMIVLSQTQTKVGALLHSLTTATVPGSEQMPGTPAVSNSTGTSGSPAVTAVDPNGSGSTSSSSG